MRLMEENKGREREDCKAPEVPAPWPATLPDRAQRNAEVDLSTRQ